MSDEVRALRMIRTATESDYEWGDTVDHDETLANEGYPISVVFGGALFWAEQGHGRETFDEFREYIEERIEKFMANHPSES